MADASEWNRCQYEPSAATGHHESWFQRANHPQRPLAFWIRYTLFSPQGRPQDAFGELWAIYFDGERGRIVAVKEAVPLGRCRFSTTELDARIGMATLNAYHLEGRARSSKHTVRWQLDYSGDDEPLLLLPKRCYAGGSPKAKALVGLPNALYRGALAIDGEQIRINGWQGSQNHHWGSQHTGSCAWGQVAGFDNAPEAFLECSTARRRLGGMPMPSLTVVVLRLDGRQFTLNTPAQALRASGRFDFFEWRLRTSAGGVRISANLHAPAPAFVGLRYDNPAGGSTVCLNTELAACTVVVEQPGKPARTLVTTQRAAFEILTERSDHGVDIAA
jgi:hypothetical protein